MAEHGHVSRLRVSLGLLVMPWCHGVQGGWKVLQGSHLCGSCPWPELSSLLLAGPVRLWLASHVAAWASSQYGLWFQEAGSGGQVVSRLGSGVSE